MGLELISSLLYQNINIGILYPYDIPMSCHESPPNLLQAQFPTLERPQEPTSQLEMEVQDERCAYDQLRWKIDGEKQGVPPVSIFKWTRPRILGYWLVVRNMKHRWKIVSICHSFLNIIMAMQIFHLYSSMIIYYDDISGWWFGTMKFYDFPFS